MDSAAAIQGPIHTLLSGRLKLLVQGLLLASRVKTLVRTSVELHTSLEVPISKEQVKSKFGSGFVKASTPSPGVRYNTPSKFTVKSLVSDTLTSLKGLVPK